MAPELSSPETQTLPLEPLRFSGSGAEFFRIWIVNLALTVVTLGIYSAWAKVRKLQYFYRHTQLAGSSFDYLGRPTAILKGRLITFGLLGVGNAVYSISPVAGVLIWIPIAAVLPWLLVRSLRFRMHNTTWRGLRFHFDGSVGRGYVVFLLWPLATLVTLGLLWPRAHRELKHYQHGHTRFGRAAFVFNVSPGGFYPAYARAALFFVLAPVIAVFVLSPGVGLLAGPGGGDRTSGVVAALVVVGVTVYACSLASGPYLASQIQNLVWNRTELPPHRFVSTIHFGRLCWIVASNLVLTIVTLGLYRPFGMVRMARYRVSCLALMPGGSLDHFVGDQASDVEAFGEELAESLDIDIAL
ncbi:MAG: YjgN family protein [Betaproteobacteria bacterium]